MYQNNESFKYIKEIRQELKFLTNSEVRLKILIELCDRKATLKELHKLTNLKYTSLTSSLSKLEENGYVYEENDYYYLKTDTRNKLINILYLNNNFEFIENLSNYINKHIVENELDAVATLPMIKNYELIKADNINPYIVVEMIEDALMYNGNVRSLNMYLHPHYEKIITTILNQESSHEMIVPYVLLERFVQAARKNKTTIKNKTTTKNKNFYIKAIKDKTPKLICVVSEEKLIIALVKRNGKPDNNYCICIYDDDAIRWGYQIFEEYNMKTDIKIPLHDLTENIKQSGNTMQYIVD